MHNDEKILQEGSKAFKLMKRLRKYASICFNEEDFKYEAAMSNISTLENLFKPYALELERIEEERKQHELRLKQICAEEGHIGEWIEDTYHQDIIIDRQLVENYPLTRWIRTCTRCGKQEVSETEPDEVKKLRKRKEIDELEEKLRQMTSEL